MTQNTELTNYLTLNKFQHTSTMIKYIKGNVIKKKYPISNIHFYFVN